MGCIWSGEDANRCAHCNRRPVNNLIFIDNVCEICIGQASRPASTKPRFGEYRCSCGRFWTSRLSWARSYQICKRCRKQVYANYQRELRPSPSDLSHDKQNRQEHQKEYCQMCQQLGHYCGSAKYSGNGGHNVKGRRKRYSH